MIKNTLLSLALSAGLIIGSGVGFSVAQAATCVCNAYIPNNPHSPIIKYLGGNTSITECSPCISYCIKNYSSQAETDGGQVEAVIHHPCVGD